MIQSTGRAGVPGTSAELNDPMVLACGTPAGCPFKPWGCTLCQKQSQHLPAPCTSPACARTDVPGRCLRKQIQRKPAQQIRPEYWAFAEVGSPAPVCCVASRLFVLVLMWGEQLDGTRLCAQDQCGLIAALEMLVKLGSRFAKMWFPVF